MENLIMPAGLSESFRKRVLDEYDGARSVFLTKSEFRSEALQTGHPQFTDLAIGERRSADMASVFLDLTNFTGRTFWDSSEEVTDLAHAVLSGFALMITQLGGHVLGLRGDGLFAGFGPVGDARVSVAYAALAAAGALQLVGDVLNPALVDRGVEPVQARAGADFGKATFVRSGTGQVSEVNVIGFSSNFAAKCEKSANSWELVVGETFASHISDRGLLTAHKESPKRYTRKGETKAYRFYNYAWGSTAAFAGAASSELGGRSLEQVY